MKNIKQPQSQQKFWLSLPSLLLLLLLLAGETACDHPSPCDGIFCNNGNCVVLADGTPKCECYPGYYGDCLDSQYDACLLIECQNGGTCTVDSLNSRKATCNCPPEYYGTFCEKLNPCYPSPCLNGGTCQIDSLGLAVCTCPPGYSGSDCSSFDPCYNVNCPTNASCNAVTGECACNTGYEIVAGIDSCQAIVSKYLGAYNAADNCLAGAPYLAQISADASNVSYFNIENLYNLARPIRFKVFTSLKFKLDTDAGTGTQFVIVGSDTIAEFFPPTNPGLLNTIDGNGVVTVHYRVKLANDPLIKSCDATLTPQ